MYNYFVVNEKRSIWPVLILVLLSGLINGSLPYFLGCLFFQAFMIFTIFNVVRDYRQTRNGPIVQGTVTAAEDITPTGDDDENYDCTVIFRWPAYGREFFLKRKMYSSNHPAGKQFRIWVNEADLDKSLFMDDVDNAIPACFLLVIFFVAIGFSEWQLIKPFFN